MQRIARTPPNESEAGFTLVELLITMTILGIIMSSIVAALVFGFKTQGDAGNRMALSHDEQLLSLYFPSDVQSADSISGADLAAGTATGCSSAPLAGGNNVLHLQWTNPSGGFLAASYRAEQPAASSWQLTRYSCVVGSAAKATVVVHNLASSAAATATLVGNKVALSATNAISGQTHTFKISGTPRTVALGGTTSTSTTTVAPTTTTTVAPTTTTLAPTTTTTTAAACAVTADSVTPSTASANGSGKLSANETVSVATSGVCSTISVRFTPDNLNPSSVVTLALSGGTVVIGKNDYSWSNGSHPFTILNGVTVLTPPTPLQLTVA
jgi:prepilin-type N-terminal cleavage/methylation domain-containing protein